MSTMTSPISPGDLLGSVRGPITDASLTYPERMRLEVTDAHGGLWRLATWEAAYSPADPAVLNRKIIVGADLDKPSGTLTVSFSDGTCFVVTPIPDETDDAIENWQLFTPDGLVLNYGPGDHWVLKRASDPA